MGVLEYNDGFKLTGKAKPIQYVISKDPWECWNCVSHPKDKDGYCKITRNKKNYRLHRYIYELEKGKIHEGYVVQHLCDNPSCFKPEHLVASTQLENDKQAYIKGRKTNMSMRDSSGKFIQRVKN